MTDTVQQEYNKFINLPLLGYNIVSYLMDHNELIFKLLKYNDNRAFEKPDLTKEEKASLIYNGQGDTGDFRIFLDIGIDDSILKEITMLRISPVEVLSNNYVYGYVVMGFEVYSHSKTNTMANYQTKVDTIVQQLLLTLNGADIDGIGRLFFDRRNGDKVTVFGAIPYRGKFLTMCNNSLG
jgi:hypothetical protein